MDKRNICNDFLIEFKIDCVKTQEYELAARLRDIEIKFFIDVEENKFNYLDFLEHFEKELSSKYSQYKGGKYKIRELKLRFLI